MITVVNKGGLRAAVNRYLSSLCHIRPMMVWSQYGFFTAESVRDVAAMYGGLATGIRVTVNDDEFADTQGFISESLSRRGPDGVLIMVSFLPFGKETADTLMSRYVGDFECVRYRPDPEEWGRDNRGRGEVNRPILDFIARYPEHFSLPYWKMPNVNTAGPSEQTWGEVSGMWTECVSDSPEEWGMMSPELKVRKLLVRVGTAIGPSYDTLITDLREFLLEGRRYDDIYVVPAEKDPDPDGTVCQASFMDVFTTNEKGELIWK